MFVMFIFIMWRRALDPIIFITAFLARILPGVSTIIQSELEPTFFNIDVEMLVNCPLIAA